MLPTLERKEKKKKAEGGPIVMMRRRRGSDAYGTDDSQFRHSRQWLLRSEQQQPERGPHLTVHNRRGWGVTASTRGERGEREIHSRGGWGLAGGVALQEVAQCVERAT